MAGAVEEPAVLSARGLSKRYRRRGERGVDRWICGLDRLSLEIYSGEVLSLVGPSGSGKSTLARCLAFLDRPDEGEILFRGRSVDFGDRHGLRMMRRNVQLVFQDPVSSVNPRFTVSQALAEPLRIGKKPSKPNQQQLQQRLEEVGLLPSTLGAQARSLSGGQLQRLALARSLATEPEVLVLDESLSGLDLSLQARLVNLILDLVDQRALTCVLITHNPSLAAHVADRVVHLAGGRLVGDSTSDVDSE